MFVLYYEERNFFSLKIDFDNLNGQTKNDEVNHGDEGRI